MKEGAEAKLVGPMRPPSSNRLALGGLLRPAISKIRIPRCEPHVAMTLSTALIAALSVGASCATGAFAQSRDASEYQIKAEFLYNFAKIGRASSRERE